MNILTFKSPKMKVVLVIVFFMFAMVTIPYLFLENMPFDKVIAYQDECGNIIVQHSINHGFVSSIIYYSLFISVAIGLPFIEPKMPKMLKVIFYALGFWVLSALVAEIYSFGFPEIEPPLSFTMYARFLFATFLLVTFLIVKNSWIQRVK